MCNPQTTMKHLKATTCSSNTVKSLLSTNLTSVVPSKRARSSSMTNDQVLNNTPTYNDATRPSSPKRAIKNFGDGGKRHDMKQNLIKQRYGSWEIFTMAWGINENLIEDIEFANELMDAFVTQEILDEQEQAEKSSLHSAYSKHCQTLPATISAEVKPRSTPPPTPSPRSTSTDVTYNIHSDEDIPELDCASISSANTSDEDYFQELDKHSPKLISSQELFARLLLEEVELGDFDMEKEWETEKNERDDWYAADVEEDHVIYKRMV